jgi:hypothetical protein
MLTSALQRSLLTGVSALRPLFLVASIVAACGGESDAANRAGTFTLREFGRDGALPFTFQDYPQYKLVLTGGSLTLRDNHTFDLRLDFEQTIKERRKAPWKATGSWSISGPDELELHSAAFGEDDPARGLFETIEDGSPDVAHGNVHPGAAVVLTLRFQYEDGITYGLDSYTFQ